MPTVWFIRHTESEANAGFPTAYPATIKLTPRGVEQAKCIAQSFTRQPHLIITSPYLRTWQTAEPTFARFPAATRDEWPVHEFTYLSPGSTLTTLNDRRPKVDDYWNRCDPFYVDGKDAESFVEFIARVQDVLLKLRQSKDDFIVVFSHEQFIRSIAWLILKGKIGAETSLCSDCMKSFRYFFKSFPMPNGSIMRVQLQDNDETWVSNIITSHLSELCPLV